MLQDDTHDLSDFPTPGLTYSSTPSYSKIKLMVTVCRDSLLRGEE